MPRARFVQPMTVRLYLVDVHKRAYADLTTRELPKTATAAAKATRAAALATLQAAIDQAAADADFLDVKAELNAGEERDVFSRQLRPQGLGDRAVLDHNQVWKSKIVAYVLGWSFIDATGQPVPFSEDALDALDLDSYAEIRDAIDWHESTVEAGRAARKNGTGGERTSSAISPSVSTTAGDTNGSAHSTPMSIA